MLRLVVDNDGQIWPDFSAKLPGRGVYLCMSEDCLKKLSDKRLQVLKRDFSPQLPQWQVFQDRMSDMLALRIRQLMQGMKRNSAIGRDAVMHSMWSKGSILVLLASDAGKALVRQVEDAVEKRKEGRGGPSFLSQVQISQLDAMALGLALGREKVSVVAFLEGNPLQKLQQLCVWQQAFEQTRAGGEQKESKVTNGE